MFEAKSEQQTINGTNKLAVMSLKDKDCFAKNPLTNLLDYYSDKCIKQYGYEWDILFNCG